MQLTKDKLSIEQVVLETLCSSSDRNCCLEELLTAIYAADREVAKSIILIDVQRAVQRLVAEGKVTVKYNAKSKVDIVTAVEIK